MPRVQASWIAAGLGLALVASPARALQTNGFQTIVDFEEFAAGAASLHYADLDTFISAGTVSDAGTAGYIAHSGTQVYVGTSILSQQTDGDFDFQGIDLWPAIGAFVSPGGSDVTATFYGYDPNASGLVVLGSLQTVGGAPNQSLSWTWVGGPSLIDVKFTSDSPFAIDDLTLGLPDVPGGVPEPATWATMLLGLAGVGLVLRARRRAGDRIVVS